MAMIDGSNLNYRAPELSEGSTARQCRVWTPDKGLLKFTEHVIQLVPATSANPFAEAVAAMDTEVTAVTGDGTGGTAESPDVTSRAA